MTRYLGGPETPENGSGNVMVCNDWRFDLFAGS